LQDAISEYGFRERRPAMRFETVALLWMLWHVLVVGVLLLWFAMGTPESWAKFWAATKECFHEAGPRGHHAH
jgi:hypothetical protein